MDRIAAKLGISMLAVLLMTVGTVSADGGSSCPNAEWINVPDGSLRIFGPHEFSGDDHWKFDANSGDVVYIDLEYWFAHYGGAMYLRNVCGGSVIAWVTGSSSKHSATVTGTEPRIEIDAGSEYTYKFVVGRNA